MNSRESPGRIQVLNRQRRCKIYRKSVALFCDAVFESLGRPKHPLSVAFISAEEMRSLNSRYLKRNYATDVLSFSYGSVKMEGIPFLGEIVIAPEIAADQARRFRISPDKELRKLLVHGILHLLGYDHVTDQGQMYHFQRKLLRRKFFQNAASLTDLKVNQ
jgi:probable rRNA maturation factor